MVRASVSARAFQSTLANVTSSADSYAKVMKKAGQDASGEMDNTKTKTKGLMDQMGPLGGMIGKAFAVGAIFSFGKEILTTAGAHQALLMQLKFVTGSAEAADKQFATLKATSKQLGLNFNDTAAAFKGFAASSKFAGVSMDEINYQFKAVASASSAMGLSAQEQQGVFLALSQMMSKGTVSAEELKGQLGERLPGAFSILAQSLGLTEMELNKMLETGSLLAKDVLPVLAVGLNNAFSQQTLDMMDSMNNKTANLGTSWDGFMMTIGTTIGPTIAKMLDAVSFGLNKISEGIHWVMTDAKTLGKEAAAKAEVFTAQNAETLIMNTMREMQAATGATVTRAEAAQKAWDKTSKSYAVIVERVRQFKAGLTNDAASQRDLELANIQKSVLMDEIDRAKAAEEAKGKIKETVAANQKKKDEAAAKKIRDDEAKRLKEIEKGIKDEYDIRLKAMEEVKKLSEMDVKLKSRKDENAPGIGEKQAAYMKLEIEKKFLEDKLVLNQKYNGKIPKLVEDESRILKKELELKKKELKEAGSLMFAILGDNVGIQREVDMLFRNMEAAIEKNSAKSKEKLRKDNEDKIKSNSWYQAQVIKDEKQGSQSRESFTLSQNKKLIENQIETNKELIDNNLNAANEGNQDVKDATAKANQDLIDQNRDLSTQLLDIDKQRAAQRVEVVRAGIQLAQDVFNGFSQLNQANMDQEMAKANAVADAQLKLADGNKQKIAEIEATRAAKEKEIRIKKFKADQLSAMANVVFMTAPQIAQYKGNIWTQPLALIAIASAAAQIAFIMAQPIPEYAKGTRGKAHKGGPAMVGEMGTEKVITESGQVYYTPPTATLINLPKGAQVIPNHVLRKEELLSGRSMTSTAIIGNNGDGLLINKMTEIGQVLKGLPIHQINMDEKGFHKFIKTDHRSTKILNNRFPTAK